HSASRIRLFPYTTLFRSNILKAQDRTRAAFFQYKLSDFLWRPVFPVQTVHIPKHCFQTKGISLCNQFFIPKAKGRAKESGRVSKDRKSTRLNSSHVSISY